MACEEGAAETQLSRRLPIACTVRLCAWLAGPGEGTAKRPWAKPFRMPTSDALHQPVPLSCPPAVPSRDYGHATKSTQQSAVVRGLAVGTYLSKSSPGLRLMLCDTISHWAWHCAVPHHLILRQTAPTRLHPSPRHCATFYECCTVSAVRTFIHTTPRFTPLHILG